jgi:YidC/Oxa1 family membrane protein insertase
VSSLFSWLSDFFFAILQFLHEGLGISWSWAIVLLTVIIRVVLIPLTWRQIKSMRAMQALQPHVKALQEKYKHDRELLNQKLMEFYRENKVSPFGSCLPLLLQLPVFLGLFYMLRNQGVVNSYVDAGAFASVWHSDLVSWLWIGDITKFDIWLLFLYVGSQFASSWQMARRNPGQQRTIALMLPLIFGVLMYFWKWPAGLMIYWFTSNLWSIAQQLVAERIMPVPVAAAAVLEKDKAKAARVKVGGNSGAAPGVQKKTQARKGASEPVVQTPTRPAGKSGGKSGARRKRKKR